MAKDLTRRDFVGSLTAVFGAFLLPPRIASAAPNCGCSNMSFEFYSLLSCCEKNGMAVNCGTCQKLGRLVVKMQARGKTLDQIRAAVDAGSAETERVQSSRNPFKT